MNVLMLVAYYPPEITADTHLEQDLIEGMVSKGWNVFVICPTPTRGISKDVVAEYKHKKFEKQRNGKVIVHRFWAPQEGSKSCIRALRYLWCCLRQIHIAKHLKNIDVIYCNSTPPIQGLAARAIKKKFDCKFVYSLQDVFPDSLVNAGMTQEKSLVWKIGKKIENITYKNASKIITISEDFKRNVLSKGVQESKIVVIPNWIDTSEIYPINRSDNKVLKKYNLESNKFYISYCGNIGHSQNLELLVDVAKEIEKQTNHIEFVIIGEGAAKDQLKQMITDNQLNNVHLLPYQPYDDIAHVFSLGDIGLIISKPGIGGCSVPSKTWSIMAAHRPVLASFDKGGDLDKVINQIGCGVLVDAGDKNALVKAIMDMYSEKKKFSIMADNGFRYVSEVVSKSKCVGEYIQVLENQDVIADKKDLSKK